MLLEAEGISNVSQLKEAHSTLCLLKASQENLVFDIVKGGKYTMHQYSTLYIININNI